MLRHANNLESVLTYEGTIGGAPAGHRPGAHRGVRVRRLSVAGVRTELVRGMPAPPVGRLRRPQRPATPQPAFPNQLSGIVPAGVDELRASPTNAGHSPAAASGTTAHSFIS